MLDKWYQNFMLVAALFTIGWGGFIYVNDIRALSADMAVRNVGYAVHEICGENDSEHMWRYLAEQTARFNRYSDSPHRFTSAATREDLGCES